MAQQIILNGVVANDGKGNPLRDAWTKTNANLTELYTAIAAIDPKVAAAVAAVISTLAIANVNGLQAALDSKATPANIQSAIAALVASSPATLDTLNELAAALGNDPNFATTITNALASKAPLASPTFAGTPTAPTPAQGDNSLKLATTAFVTALVASVAQGISYKTLGDADATLFNTDRIVVLGSVLTAPRTWTLPAAASVSNGTQYRILDIAAGISATNTLTIAAASGETINGSSTRVLAAPRAEAVLFSDGVSAWFYGVAPSFTRGQIVALGLGPDSLS